MKAKGILQSISFLLLGVILYMHLCSALCATGTSVCCDKEDDHHSKKKSYSHEENYECKEKDCEDSDCQNMHFVFFGVTGQFAQAKADISFKVLPSLIAVISPVFTLQPVQTGKSFFDYNIFHPPPLNTDMRILMRSFLI